MIGEFSAHKLLKHGHMTGNLYLEWGSIGLAQGNSYLTQVGALMSGVAGDSDENAPCSLSVDCFISY